MRAAADFVRKHGFDAVRVLRLPRNRGKGYAGAAAGSATLFARRSTRVPCRDLLAALRGLASLLPHGMSHKQSMFASPQLPVCTRLLVQSSRACCVRVGSGCS